MKLSVIILNYNVRYFLELCLKSVEAAIPDIHAEIIVVDNDSKDDSCQMVKTRFPNVKLIENKTNYGFSKGNNIGVAQAKGEYVCILNPDTVVSEDTFITLLNFCQSKENLGIVGCRLIDGCGKFLPESKRNVPTPLVSVKKILGFTKAYYANHLNEHDTGEVAVLVGAFMLLKRNVYHKINGFDEDFFMYGEDIDFSYRIQKAGYRNFYNPSTTIIHFKGESTLKDKIYAKRFNEAMQIFFKKHFKPNILYQAFIWLGIKMIIIINPQPKIKKTIVKGYRFFSKSLNAELKAAVSKPFNLFSEVSELKDYEQVIFDNNQINFKRIINHYGHWSSNYKVSFKILPKDTNFIIGSNSSKSKGEVIEF